MLRQLLIALVFVASSTAIHAPGRPPFGGRTSRASTTKEDLVAAKAQSKPPGILKQAYAACGMATTAAWSTIVYTTIRSNQPIGAMMPSPQHRLFANIGALSAAPLIASCFATLASASDSWEKLGTETSRRTNLALVAAGIGGALWVGFAPTITKIPGGDLSHQSYKGAMRTSLIGAYGSAAALSAAVWVQSLPEEARKDPLSWPGRVADGVAKSLFSLAPKSVDDPVNVKYSLLATSMLTFTALQLGSFPLSVVPSWTGRRCSRHFPTWTLLAAVTSYNLKEARENGKLLVDSTYRTLAHGLAGMGAVYLVARFGAVFLDPTFPGTYGAAMASPAWQAFAALMFGLAMRSDTECAK